MNSSFPGGPAVFWFEQERFCTRRRYDAREATLRPEARSFREKRPINRLFADSKFLDDVFVTFGIVLLQIVQQATPLADHHQQTPPGGMVFFMVLEVLRQLADPLAQDCNLYFRATGI